MAVDSVLMETDIEKLARAKREEADVIARGTCSGYEREITLAREAKDPDAKKWHEDRAATHAKAHGSHCECTARHVVIMDLEERIKLKAGK